MTTRGNALKNLPIVRWRLATWLQVLGLMAIFPILVLVGYFSWELSRKQNELIVEDLHHRLEDISHLVEYEIGSAESALRTLGESGAALRGDKRALYEQARRILKHNSLFIAVDLVKPDGAMLFNTSLPFNEKTFPATHLDQIRSAIETGQSNVTGLIKSPFRPEPVVAVTVPARLKDDQNYSLRMIMLSSSFSRLITDKKLPDGWISGIIDRQGILIARNTSPDLYVGKPAAPAFQEAARLKQYLPFESVTRDGVVGTTLVAPIHAGDWHLGLIVPNSKLHEPLREMTLKLIILALLWLGVAALLAHKGAHFVSRQMRRVLVAIDSPDEASQSLKSLRVLEFKEIYDGFMLTKGRVAQMKSNLNSVQIERDEAYDLYENAPCGYHSLDREGRILGINQTELNWLGYRRDEVLGQPLTKLLSSASQAEFKINFAKLLSQGSLEDFEIELIRKDGSVMTMLVQISAVHDESGQFIRSRTTTVDISERKRLEAQLELLANTDNLTGLSNRRDFYRQADREIARSHRHGMALSVLILDIDHFKQVNDRYGHAVGDLVLKKMGEVLKKVMRETDITARIGGEEFAVLMPDTSISMATDVAERLRLWIAQEKVKISMDGMSISVTTSMGVAQLSTATTNIGQLLKNADAALYLAKREGRNQVRQSA